MVRQLTEAERIALRRWAATYGRSWRKDLWHAWQTGNYGCRQDVAAELQTLRNTMGPSWLYKVSLKEV